MIGEINSCTYSEVLKIVCIACFRDYINQNELIYRYCKEFCVNSLRNKLSKQLNG